MQLPPRPELSEYTGTLNPDHLAYAETIREFWWGVALSTDRADRPATEDLLRQLYAAHDMSAPLIVWRESPPAGAVAAQSTKNTTCRDNLAGFDAELLELAKTEKGARDQFYRSVDAMNDAYWLAFQMSARAIAGLEPEPKLDLFAAVTASCGWWWPQEGVVVVTERAAEIHTDQQMRWHNETGPAVLYADGYSVDLWHGTPIPAWVRGADGGPTIARITAETNTEVRRCGIESYGWHRYVVDAGLTLVDEQPDPGNDPYTIQLYDAPPGLYDFPVRVMVCTNGTIERDGTRHQYGLTVPQDINDAIEAAAASYGVTREEYMQLKRRT